MGINVANRKIEVGTMPGMNQVNSGIVGFGAYIPDQTVTNQDLENCLDTTKEWIAEKTGIFERRVLDSDNATSYMCIEAAKEALRNTGILAKDLDAIVITTFTPDYILPSTALIVKEAIGADKAIPIDLNQVACAGTLYGMVVGQHFLMNPNHKNVMVIGAETMSRITNPQDRSTYVFFGDAAGAIILRRMKKGVESGILGWDIQSKLSMDVHVPAGGSKYPISQEQLEQGRQYLNMNGRSVWENATTKLPESIRSLLDKHKVNKNDVDLFLLHQANLNIIKECMSLLDMPMEKTFCNVNKYGNTSAATLPVVLNDAYNSGKINHGDLLVFATIGAGYFWGSMLVKFSENAADFE
ncbi:3-oxoacyl-ACP synthase III family protein [Sporosarcina limicola]|uniref:3-oxoacyl-[acyl-carrier-protein] synthase-3 n=1 Tax=Sporosarcina limicola TaxID=34101 RepID=A0A927RH31_9BACL|nr:beta-ketoacyl-ACP synthase 3 [Sporosarcina limicola]MBE1557072.1 3-oxoacyl-[acyl-carrier-protein] synthase-3 [Sporosarcina limicola]